MQINGVGLLRVGMAVARAEQFLGMALPVSSVWPQNNTCYYVAPNPNELDMSFMVTGGLNSRVDIGRESPILTLSGAGVGDSEAQEFAFYPEQIEVHLHPYVLGHYLEFVPRDASDRVGVNKFT